MGWLDNYGKAENANEGKSTGPAGSIYGGTSNKGRNYSPAWGGQFQDGGAIDMYGNPFITGMVNDESVERSYYDPRRNQMFLGADYNERPDERKLKTMAHENYHAKQFKEGRSNFDIAHNTPDRFWAEMQKRPQMMTTDEEYYKFHNRKPRESQMNIDRIKNEYEELRYVPNDIIMDKIVDPLMYDDPYSLEGEAQYYENTGREFANGGSMPGSVGFTYARTGSIPSNGKFAKKTMASAQDGLQLFTQQTIDSAQYGRIIDDEMGQWRHPGEITRIPSNNITMQGVDYPVLGISDTGDKKLMQPGENYKFKGNKVTEFPMAKDGSQLTKLDQLTNFTNYNTPQPGGWLNKYK